MIVPDVSLKHLGAQGCDNMMLRLKKSLYDLKLAGRLQKKLLDTKLIEDGFSDACLAYVCISAVCLCFSHNEGKLTIVGVYVNDLLVTATSLDKVKISLTR